MHALIEMHRLTFSFVFDKDVFLSRRNHRAILDPRHHFALGGSHKHRILFACTCHGVLVAAIRHNASSVNENHSTGCGDASIRISDAETNDVPSD